MFTFQFKNGIDTEKLYTLYTVQHKIMVGKTLDNLKSQQNGGENVANRFTIVIITIGAKIFL